MRWQKSGGKVLRKANQPFTPEDGQLVTISMPTSPTIANTSLSLVEPPNKGHFGKALCSLYGGCPLWEVKMYWNYREELFGTSSCVLYREVYYNMCPYLGESTVEALLYVLLILWL